MNIVLILLAILYTFVLSLNYIIGVIQTPPGLLFLGSVHYPVDYFYYLSLFAQGQTRWITAVDLYTHEFRDTLLLGFTNVMGGRITSLFGLPPIEGYQVALAAYTIIFFLVIIRLLSSYYPTMQYRKVVAFVLFGIANTFPGASSFYSNATEPLIRFARVPHKMLGLICSLLPILIVLKLQEKKHTLNTNIVLYIFLAFCGIIAANINPVQWLLVSLVLGTGLLWNEFRKNDYKFRNTLYAIHYTDLLPVFIFFVTGLPMAFYLTRLFTIPPFHQSAIWESTQFVSLSILTLIQSFGPVVLLAIFGLPLIQYKKISLPRMFMILYFLLSLMLFISPLSRLVHATNTRFLSAITMLAAALLATDFITTIPFPKRIRATVSWIIVIILCVYQIPLFVAQFKRNANLATNNSYIYISQDAYQAMMETKKITTDKDTILVTWPFDQSFPGLTGRRGYMGNPDQTIDPELKNKLAYYFFDAKESDEEMHNFLLNNGITYVLGFSSTEKIKKSFMQPVYQNTAMTLYKVLE